MDILKLNAELEDAIVNFQGHHQVMANMLTYYKYSVFFAPKNGDPIRKDLTTNLLKVFADKNIFYTSGFPTIKVLATPEDRKAASTREKILYAVHRESNTPLLRRRWARDATVLSAAIAETGWDHKKKRAFVRRYDPRHCVWQLSNDNDRSVIAFWALFPITADECQQKYGFRPSGTGGLSQLLNNDLLKHIDGKDWFMQAIRWDGETRQSWVGNQVIEEKHKHGFSQIPIDVCIPIDENNENSQGSFYIEPLISPQAELNHVVQQRAKIVERMANPVVWGRGIVTRGFDDIKAKLQNSGGGFVGLGRQGEVGLLQVNDVKMLNDHEDRIIQHMHRLSGFGAAAFGESVGANTSGDALGMYFNPTQRMVEDQFVAWKAFDESINRKILEAYDKFMVYGEQLSISGYAPGGTLTAMDDGTTRSQSGAFAETFNKSVIAGNYNNIAIQRPITPKNEIDEKNWALSAVQQGVISRTTGYDMMGILSPEDELELLKSEQSEPVLNPDGAMKILQGAQNLTPTATPPAVPAGAGVNGA